LQIPHCLSHSKSAHPTASLAGLLRVATTRGLRDELNALVAQLSTTAEPHCLALPSMVRRGSRSGRRASLLLLLQLLPATTCVAEAAVYSRDQGFSSGPTGAVSTVSGGYKNTAIGEGCSIGGGEANTAKGFAGTIAGGDSNTIGSTAYGAFIGGGGKSPDTEIVSSGNWVSNDFAAIVGGTGNEVEGAYGFLGGGRMNSIQSNASKGVVAGGEANTASGDHACVVGGLENTAGPGSFAAVGGGISNHAKRLASFVGGGAYNTALAISSTVGGGGQNVASGKGATVAGGGADAALWDVPSSERARQLAYAEPDPDPAKWPPQSGNRGSGGWSAVGGGGENTAAGGASTIPGGLRNTATGFGSVAMGVAAAATHNFSAAFAFNATAMEEGSSSSDRCESKARPKPNRRGQHACMRARVHMHARWDLSGGRGACRLAGCVVCVCVCVRLCVCASVCVSVSLCLCVGGFPFPLPIAIATW
jgi:hypothetical protein